MERKNVYICMLAALLSCSDSVKVSRTLDAMPAIFPDYNGVVIPPNMAPLNFALDDQDAGSRAVFSFGGQQFEVKGEKGSIVIPPSKWKNLLESAAGDSIQVTVQVKQGNEWVAYSPFTIRVAPEKVDSYLAYRLIDPGSSPEKSRAYEIASYSDPACKTNGNSHSCFHSSYFQ